MDSATFVQNPRGGECLALNSMLLPPTHGTEHPILPNRNLIPLVCREGCHLSQPQPKRQKLGRFHQT
jgi:hypothetical protein